MLYDSIAEIPDSNPNAIRALLSRARLKFRESCRMSQVDLSGLTDACLDVMSLMGKYIDGEATPQEFPMPTFWKKGRDKG